MRTWMFAIGLVVVAACGRSKAAPPVEPPDSCKVDKDCPEGWHCLGAKCANPASGAIYTDPAHAVTPEKVKDQVEKVNAQHEENVDDKMKKAEE
jgi:hypothetical protein